MRVSGVLVAGLMLAACSSSQPEKPKFVAMYVYDLAVNEDWAQTRIRLSVDGQVIAEGTRKDGLPEQFRVTRELVPPLTYVRARQLAWNNTEGRPKPGLPVVTAAALTPCGWKPLPVLVKKPYSPQENLKESDIELRAEVEGARNTMFVQGREGMLMILVDNRNAPERELRVGEWTYKVRADAAEMVYTGLPECEQARAVVLDGIETAVLPEDPSQTLLLDPTGARCYHFRGVNYYQAGVNGFGGASYSLSRKKLHVIAEARGQIDYLFSKAPPRLHSAIGFAHKTELTDLRCGGVDSEW